MFKHFLLLPESCSFYTPTLVYSLKSSILLKHLLNESCFGFRITHSGSGVPESLLNEMFGSDGEASEAGIGLLISRNLVKLMNGDVQYLREAGKSTFIIFVELAASNKPQS